MKRVIELYNVTKDYKIPNENEKYKRFWEKLLFPKYKTIHAVDNISFQIGKGEIVGYLGLNGAGKSTTIKMMTGIIVPSCGEIFINGDRPYENRVRNMKDIGVVFGQRTQLWWDLPLIESFKVLKEIYKIDEITYKSTLNLYEELVHVEELYGKTVRQMSLGQRTLCDILAAFLHNPSIVFLDEPTIGLDITMKKKIRQLIKSLNESRNTTVVVTTHDIGDIDALCERIIVLDKGKLVYDDLVQNLKKIYGIKKKIKILVHNEMNSNEQKMQLIKSQIHNLCNNNGLIIEEKDISISDCWININVNMDYIKIFEIVSLLQREILIHDVIVENVTTEDILLMIYEEL